TTVEVSSASTRGASVMIITPQYAKVYCTPPDAYRADRDDPLAVIADRRKIGRRGPNVDLQSIIGKSFRNSLSPLDDGDGVGHRSIKIKIIQLVGGRQPISIHMHQGRPADRRGVDAGQHEGRRNDRALRAKSAADSLRQGGFPSAKIPTGDDHTPPLEQRTQPPPEPYHGLASRNLDRQRQRLGQDHTMRNRTIHDKPSVLPEGDELRKLRSAEEFDPGEALDSRKLLGGGHHCRRDAMPLQLRMNRNPREPGVAIAAGKHDDHPRLPAPNRGEET